MSVNKTTTITLSETNHHCPIGELVGNQNLAEKKIPVLSCEGACIRGEIARLAANLIARKKGYGRACHGELLTVPQSAIAQWVRQSEQVVLIDGCYLNCHGRLLEHIIDREKLRRFDAMAHHQKYSDIFDYDDVPADQRIETAQEVASWVVEQLAGSQQVAISSCRIDRPCCCG